MRSNPILSVLDQCAARYSFPALDNGYIYPAATRLALFRSPATGGLSDWALVIEQFGFSPRAGHPDTSVLTFASRLHQRNKETDYVDASAHRRYLANNPHNESRVVFSVDFASALDDDDPEFIAARAATVLVRGRRVAIPSAAAFATHGIELAEPPRIRVFEMCRFLAATVRGEVLATPDEQRVSVPPEGLVRRRFFTPRLRFRSYDELNA